MSSKADVPHGIVGWHDPPHDAKGLVILRAERSKMAAERADLYKLTPEAIIEVRARYSALVRSVIKARAKTEAASPIHADLRG